MPHPPPRSNNKLLPLEKALAFMHGLLCDARKLTHVSYLRRDPLVLELLGIKRVASQTALPRFFQGFTWEGDNLRCPRPLWHCGMNRLPSAKEGQATRWIWLLHKDGKQEGVKGGNTRCGNNAAAFFLDLWENLPRHLRLKGVRADSGFCLAERLALWEQLKLPYVVVAQLPQPIQRLLKSDLKWTATEVPGTEAAELEYQAANWPQPRRLVVLRHRGQRRGGTRRQETARCAGRVLSSAGHEPAQHDASAAGRVAV